MSFLVCCFVSMPPFWFLHLPDSQPVLYQTWAICPQVLIKYQYPKNIFQALTTKDIVLALQPCSSFWNFFQIICPTLLHLLFECNGLVTYIEVVQAALRSQADRFLMVWMHFSKALLLNHLYLTEGKINKAPMLTGAVYMCLVSGQEYQISSEDRFIQPDTNMSAYIQTA